MRNKLLILLLFFTAISAEAQKLNEYKQMGIRMLNKKNDVDSTYIYQPPARFSFALTNKLQQVGFNALADFKFLETLPSESRSSLKERIYKKVGFEVGYGSFSFGYDVEVGRTSAHKKRALSFGSQGIKWGARISYLALENTIESTLSIGNPGSFFHYDTVGTSDYYSRLYNISLDGYYVFNKKKFAYNATSSVSGVQRRTAGSWMLTGRFMWSDLDCEEDMIGLFESYSAIQLALGGGYSVNFVLWNRDEVNNDDRTVRNITLNLTAMPVISLVNFMQTEAYIEDVQFYDSTEFDVKTLKTSNIWCYPMPNMIGSAGLSMTWGRFYFTTILNFNWFYFRSQDAVNPNKYDAPNINIEGVDGQILSDVKIRCQLYNWTLAAKLVYRFY